MSLGYVLFVVDVVNGKEKRWYLTDGGYTENINFAKVYNEIPDDFFGYIIMKKDEENNSNKSNNSNSGSGLLPHPG